LDPTNGVIHLPQLWGLLLSWVARVRTASGSDPIKTQLEWTIPSLPLRVLTRTPRRLALRQTGSFTTTPRSRVSLNDRPVARYNLERSNKSLDASGGGVFRIIIWSGDGGRKSR